MTRKEQLALIKKAVNCQGMEKQLQHFHEEIGELMTSISHFKRGRCTKEDLIIELVDARMMIDAVQEAFQVKETEYKNFLRTRNTVGMEPLFISPDYTYLNVNTNVKYNINITGRNADDIRTQVTRTILLYALNNLNNFRKTFRYSKFVQEIDSTESSIISNDTDVTLIKYLPTPRLGVSQNFTVDFKTPLTPQVPLLSDIHPIIDYHGVTSTTFTYEGITNCLLEDDGDGIMRIVTAIGTNHQKIIDIGTVDYTTGVVNISNFNISQFDGTTIKMYAIPATKDIDSVQNVILNILQPDINVTVTQIRQ